MAVKPAALLFDPPVADFGAVLAGQSRDLAVTVFGSHELKIVLSAIGSLSDPFELIETNCVEEEAVTGNLETCSLSLRFSPDAMDDFSGLLVVESDAANTPAGLNLIGSGAGDQLFSDRFESTNEP